MNRIGNYLIILIVAYGACGSTAFGANGTHFMSLSARGGGMGGVGTGAFVAPTDSLLRNGATLGLANMAVGEFLLEGDFHLGSNSISGRTTTAGTERKSLAGLRGIPELAALYRPIDKLTLGFGFLTYGGGVSEFTDQPSMFRVSAESRLFRVPLAINYTVWDTLNISVTPFLNYGELSANHSSDTTSPTSAATTRPLHGDLGFGLQAGATYGDPKKFTVGFSYTTKINHDYEALIDLDAFGATGANGIDNLQVTEPDVFALGVSGMPMDRLRLALDFRVVRWGASDLYHSLGWDNVPVIAIGGEYEINDQFAVRLGGSWGKSPQSDSTDRTSDATAMPGSLNQLTIQGHNVFPSSLALLNAFGLPATGQLHIGFGGSYNVNQALTVDLSAVIVPTKTTTRTGSNTLSVGAYQYETNQTQWSIATGATLKL